MTIIDTVYGRGATIEEVQKHGSMDVRGDLIKGLANQIRRTLDKEKNPKTIVRVTVTVERPI